jgi:hypothetical protein
MSIIPKLVALSLAATLSSPAQRHQIVYSTVTPDSQRINQLWLVTYLNRAGQEVLAVAKLASGGDFPLIAADHARLESMIPTARELAKTNNTKMRLVKFNRAGFEDIVP